MELALLRSQRIWVFVAMSFQEGIHEGRWPTDVVEGSLGLGVCSDSGKSLLQREDARELESFWNC